MSDPRPNDEGSPKVRKVRDVLQFQAHSIVSQVLLKNKGGTATLFAFDRGEGLSEHTAPVDALVVAVEGEAEVDIERETFRVSEGDVITLPGNRPHAVRAVSPFKMLLVLIKA